MPGAFDSEANAADLWRAWRSSASAREKFQREVEVMKDLLHRNIVALLEHGSAGSAFYFIMELCEGGSGGDWLARHGGRLSLANRDNITIVCLVA